MAILGKLNAEAPSKINKEASLKDKKKENTPVKKQSNEVSKLNLKKDFIFRCLFDMDYSDEKTAFILKMDIEMVKAFRAHGRG